MIENTHIVVMLVILVISSGNHAAALALAASLQGIDSHIVMPHNTPACKIENVRRYHAMREGGGGSKIHFCDSTVEARMRVAHEVEAATGAVFIAPFNDGRVIRCVHEGGMMGVIRREGFALDL